MSNAVATAVASRGPTDFGLDGVLIAVEQLSEGVQRTLLIDVNLAFTPQGKATFYHIPTRSGLRVRYEEAGASRFLGEAVSGELTLTHGIDEQSGRLSGALRATVFPLGPAGIEVGGPVSREIEADFEVALAWEPPIPPASLAPVVTEIEGGCGGEGHLEDSGCGGGYEGEPSGCSGGAEEPSGCDGGGDFDDGGGCDGGSFGEGADCAGSGGNDCGVARRRRAGPLRLLPYGSIFAWIALLRRRLRRRCRP